jgi:hypothetical protein
VHHLTYERFGHERMDDLRVLCKRCHDEADEKREAEVRARSDQAWDDACERSDNRAYDTYMTKKYGERYDLIEHERHRDEFDDWREKKRDREDMDYWRSWFITHFCDDFVYTPPPRHSQVFQDRIILDGVVNCLFELLEAFAILPAHPPRTEEHNKPWESNPH